MPQPINLSEKPYENLDDEALRVIAESTRLAANTFHGLAKEQEDKLILIHLETERRWGRKMRSE